MEKTEEMMKDLVQTLIKEAKEEAEKHTERLLTPEILDMISGLADKWGREVKADQGFLSPDKNL